MKAYEIDLKKLKRYAIKDRLNKVSVRQFPPPPPIAGQKIGENDSIITLFPDMLIARDLKEVVRLVGEARRKDRAVIFAMGGHVIKCGLGDIIIDLMRRGIISAIVMNGAASIHDFEIAMIGETSENVQAVLGEGVCGASAGCSSVRRCGHR